MWSFVCRLRVGCPLVGPQILLPYVIGCLFGIGYGSVVAAGGWEALRVPAAPGSNAASAACSGTGREPSTCGGGTGGGSSGGDGKRDISFAAQVCAWDSRAEEEAAHADADEDDEDDDLDSSGPGSDNDNDVLDVEDHRGAAAAAGRPAVAARSASSSYAEAVAARRGPARMTRSQARSVGFKDGDAGAPGSTRDEDEDATAASLAEPMPDTDALHGGGSGQEGAAPAADTAAGREDESAGSGSGSGGVGGGVGGGEHLRRVSLVHHSSSYDSPEADDEEDDEEDDSGWGQQVVVKPVKVARWDKRGLQRSKALLSLNQLRACIIERAESTPQKATYRRAAKLVSRFRSRAGVCSIPTACGRIEGLSRARRIICMCDR